MPRSKSKRRRYQPPPRKKPKPSPRWFGWTILGLGLGAVAVILLNYMNVMPGFSFFGLFHVSGETNNFYLLGGLAMIAVAFMLTTQWR